MYYGELATDMAQILLGLRSIEYLWLLLAVITIYSRKIVATTRSRGHFEPHLQFTCAEAVQILLLISDLTTPFNPAWSQTYIATKFWLKTQFYGILSHIFTAHAQKRPEYYFRYIKSDHAIRSGRHARKHRRRKQTAVGGHVPVDGGGGGGEQQKVFRPADLVCFSFSIALTTRAGGGQKFLSLTDLVYFPFLLLAGGGASSARAASTDISEAHRPSVSFIIQLTDLVYFSFPLSWGAQGICGPQPCDWGAGAPPPRLRRLCPKTMSVKLWLKMQF